MARLGLTLVALALVSGCIGSNRKPRPELDQDKPKETRGSGPLFVYREIASPPSPMSTIRLVIERNGMAELEHGGLSKQDRLADSERGSLTSLAGQVGWDSVPKEYVPKGGKSPKASTYEITFNGDAGEYTVTTHDGVDTEDETFAKLRSQLHELTRRLETGDR
jgi:hypothetical protein